MAAGRTIWLCFVIVISKSLALPDPRRGGPNRAAADYLVEYLDREDGEGPQEIWGWPKPDVTFGQVAGVDVTPSNDVIIFHRGNRSWTDKTFDADTNVMPEEERVTIALDTIVKLDSDTGDVLQSFGANTYYVPHGLTVDKGGNLWLTDVGTHQVYRIPSGETEPDLILGEKFVPGNDDKHFCKPTDVAVASNGDFFVADGYCNSRVMKYSKTGKLLGKFGMNTLARGVNTPFNFNVPHSLALIEERDIICVADRENQRVLCYNAGMGNSKLGQFNRTVVPQGDIGRVYGLAYDPVAVVMHVAAVLSETPVWDNDGYPYSPARGFTYDLFGNFLGDWDYITPREAENGPSIPHDIAVSPSGNDIYIADVMQRTVHKFTQPDMK